MQAVSALGRQTATAPAGDVSADSAGPAEPVQRKAQPGGATEPVPPPPGSGGTPLPPAFDGYNRGRQWAQTCAEVAKLRLSRRLRSRDVVALPIAKSAASDASNDGHGTVFSTTSSSACVYEGFIVEAAGVELSKTPLDTRACPTFRWFASRSVPQDPAGSRWVWQRRGSVSGTEVRPPRDLKASEPSRCRLCRASTGRAARNAREKCLDLHRQALNQLVIRALDIDAFLDWRPATPEAVEHVPRAVIDTENCDLSMFQQLPLPEESEIAKVVDVQILHADHGIDGRGRID